MHENQQKQKSVSQREWIDAESAEEQSTVWQVDDKQDDVSRG